VQFANKPGSRTQPESQTAIATMAEMGRTLMLDAEGA